MNDALTPIKKYDILFIIILALLPCLFFWRLITPNPADQMQIASGDFTEQYFPLRAFAAQQWVRGEIPLWNPYLYGGQPALADIQSGALYPVHLLQALVLGWGGPLFGLEIGFPLKALEWQVIIHFSIAAVGMFLFGRHLTLQHGFKLRRARFAGVIASLIFTYSGYLTGFPVQQLTILEVSAWLPWIMWGLTVANERMSELANGEPTPPRKSSDFLRATRTTYHASYMPKGHIVTRHSLLFTPPAVLTALAFALAILAGHPQTVMYIFYLTLAYTIFYALRATHYSKLETRNSKLKTLLSHFSLWLFSILLGSTIAAAQLLPTVEFIARSLRADLSYAAVSAGLPLTELVSILYPGFFGGSPEYVGIATLVLIALALTTALSKSDHQQQDIQRISPAPQPPRASAPVSEPVEGLPPRSQIFFWAGAAIISLLLAFGSNLFIYPIFYLFASGFDAVRQQERIFLVYSFSAAILAAYGALVLVSPHPKSTRQVYKRFEYRLRVASAVALGLTTFYIYGSANATARGDEINLFFGVLRHHIFGLIIFGGVIVFLAVRPRRWLRRWWGMSLIAVWIVFNLFTVNWRFNLEKPTNPPPFNSNGVVQFLQTNLQPFDFAQDRSPISNPSTSLRTGLLSLPPGRIASGGLLPGGNSAASIYNLQDLTGNTPLQLAAVDTFMQQMPSWRLWQLMNVRYIIEQRDISNPGLSLVFEEEQLKVFQMGDPFERAWLVSETEVIADPQRAIARLADDAFDLRRAAVVDQPLPVSLDGSATEATVTVTHIAPTHLTAEVNAAGTHLLVLSQIYYPGWQAHLDGQPAELLRVNAVQQGVIVPAGQHIVQLTYWPSSFTWGLVISAMGLLVCGGVLLQYIIHPTQRGR